MKRIALACFLSLAATAAVAQSIVKCVDADGNVTYQDPPCTTGQAGRSVELPKAETREDTTAWEDAARSARIIPGMPKRWVLRSRGAPIEIRPAAAREDATEVWRYAGKGSAFLVGFAGANVSWVRDDLSPPSAPASRPSVPSAASADGSSTKGAQNRRFVLPGRYCEHVFAEIGPADREEPTPSGANAPPPEGGKRYFYDPAAGDPSMRTAFTCIDGKVADVERTVVQ